MKIRATYILLALILLVGLGLRVARYDSIAAITSDESSYLRHARFLTTVLKKTCGVDVPVVNADADGLWRYVHKKDWNEKPCWLHAGMMVPFMLIMGPTTAAGAAVNLLFSLATVVVVFLIGTRLYGERGALCAALSLATCFYWLIYSRGFWAEVDGVFFVVLGFLFLLRSADQGRSSAWSVCWAGLSCALAVLCHYRWLYTIAPLGLVLLLLHAPRDWVRLGMAFCATFFAPIFLAAGLIRLLVVASGVETPFTGLIGGILEEYVPRQAGAKQTGIQLGNVVAYGYYMFRNCGIVFTVLGLIGITGMVLGRGRNRAEMAVCVCIAFPVLILLLQVWVVARGASLAIPFAAIAVGQGVCLLGKRLGRADWPVLSLLLVIGVGENVARDARYIQNDMGHATVSGLLTQYGARTVYADPESAITYGWYAPRVSWRPVRQLQAHLAEEAGEHTYVVFDAQRFHSYPESASAAASLEARVAQQSRDVIIVPSLTTAWREFLLEGTQAHSLREMRTSINTVSLNEIQTIRVYRLD